MNMRLEELLFCTVFFVAPVVGMIAMIIVGGLKEVMKGKNVASNKPRVSFRKRKQILPFQMFEDSRIMEYQLVESQVHIPVQFNLLKKKNQPRDGPGKGFHINSYFFLNSIYR